MILSRFLLIFVDFFNFYSVTSINKEITLLGCLLYCFTGPNPGKNEEGLKSISHPVSGDSIGIVTKCLTYIQDRAKP